MTIMVIAMMVVTLVMVLELVLLSLWTRSPVAVSTSIDDVFANTSPDTDDDDDDAGSSISGIGSNTYTIDSYSKGIGAHIEILLFEQTTKSDSYNNDDNNDDNNDSYHDVTYYHSSHWNLTDIAYPFYHYQC